MTHEPVASVLGVVCSGVERIAVVWKTNDVGLNHHLTKPTDAETLKALLDRIAAGETASPTIGCRWGTSPQSLASERRANSADGSIEAESERERQLRIRQRAGGSEIVAVTY